MSATFEASPEDRARWSIAEIERAATETAAAHDRVTLLEDARAQLKAEAIQRLMQTTNPLTNKPHSASSAEAVVETDAEYASHRKLQRSAEVDRWLTLGKYESAKLTARLDVTLVEAGVRE